MLVSLVFTSGHARAHNNQFLQGDAYFSAELNQQTIVTAKQKDGVKFAYRGYRSVMMFCGYMGYQNLSITDKEGKYHEVLRQAYATIRKAYPAEPLEEGFDGERVEPNPIKVYFYNKTYDENELGVGLRYNENWVQDQGGDGKHARYDSAVNARWSVVQDWKLGDKVPALGVKGYDRKKVMKANMGVAEPVRIASSDLKAVLIPDAMVTEVFERIQGVEFYVLVNGKLTRYRFNKDHEPIKIKIDAPKSTQKTKVKKQLKLFEEAKEVE